MPADTTTNQHALILGATSAIARALADQLAADGYNIILAARDQDENQILADDIALRHNIDAHAIPFQADAFDTHESFLAQCNDIADNTITLYAICFGYMDDQQHAQAHFPTAQRTIDINLTAAISICERAATQLEQRGTGNIIIIASVAGDRGRQSNYLYGAAKAGLTTYAQGLRNRLHHRGVHVLTVKPGFVDTKMTFGTVPFAANPTHVAKSITRALKKQRNTIYTPWFWRYILLIIQHIPEAVFKRMRM